MRVRYVGPSPRVVIASIEKKVQRDKPVEVSDALGRRLIRQGVWKQVRRRRKKEIEDA